MNVLLFCRWLNRNLGLACRSMFFCLCWVAYQSVFLTLYVHIGKFSGRKFIISVILGVADVGP